ncbi:MAG: hypothetical protein U9Q77_08795 [Candidatus Marinimicrobia bacterium]|nr:hypothetical protein [Candidatus Neomarinimicrobiota bacterium]
MTTIRTFLFTLLVISSSATAWYPEYTVMASDLVLGQNFLAPASFHSMTVYSLGVEFQDLYNSPLDNISKNPAAGLSGNSRHLLQLELGGQHLFDGGFESPGRVVPMYDYYYYLPRSQYRQTEEEQDYEPAFRFVYLGYPLKGAAETRLGIAFDWIYGISEFYQPYDEWNFRGYNAVGAALESSEDPYEDYNLREAGDDLNINQGYHLTFFLAHPLTKNTDIGARLTMNDESVDGNLRDYSFYDQSDYYDDYVSVYDSQTEREQAFNSTDLMLGINTKRADGSSLGFSGGVLLGKLDRLFNVTDSSRHFSLMEDPYPDHTLDDSTFYSRNSTHLSEKNWNYDGQTFYLGFQYLYPETKGKQFSFTLYGEDRRADLVESESLDQRSAYDSRHFYYYDTSLYEYSSSSWAVLERNGSGQLRQKLFRMSGGVDWTVSPAFRFLGGLSIQYKDRELSADEPFSGEKYAYTDRTGGSHATRLDIQRQIDEKEFSWQRSEQQLSFGLPVGFLFRFGEYFQLQSGLTKVFLKTDINEYFDVIVRRDYSFRDNNGVITETNETNFVDGYKFPDIKTFDDGFDFNAGMSFIYNDNFSASVVFTNAFNEEYVIKLGGRLSW